MRAPSRPALCMRAPCEWRSASYQGADLFQNVALKTGGETTPLRAAAHRVAAEP